VLSGYSSENDGAPGVGLGLGFGGSEGRPSESTDLDFAPAASGLLPGSLQSS